MQLRPSTSPFPSGRPVLFWSAFFVLLFALVYVLRGALLPFVLGIALAYVLSPVCDRLVHRGIPRWGAALGLLGAVVLAACSFFLIVGPVVMAQMARFAEQLPTLIESVKTHLDPFLRDVLHLPPDTVSLAGIREIGGQYAAPAAKVATGLLGTVWKSGSALFSLVSLIVVTPVVTYYLLRDWPLILKRLDSWLPRATAPLIREEVRKVDRTLSGFLRGQATVCLILSAIYAVGLTLIGVNFGLFIGLTAGLLSFIPFVGSTFGLVVSTVIAFIQFESYGPVAAVVALFMGTQFLEGNVLTPKLVGESVGLHPVWIIFALMASGSLFGFVGLLLAVPVAAVLGVGLRFGLKRYLDSRYYATGQRAPSASFRTRIKPL